MVLGGILVLLAGTARAQSCTLPEMDAPVPAGQAAAFALACEAGAAPQVAWEFGDGTPRTAYGHALSASHTYAEPGMYTVFARLSGEDVPLSITVTVVHPPTPVAPTHSSTLVHDRKRGRIFVVNPDHHTLAGLEAGEDGVPRLVFEAPVGRNPRTVAFDAEGNPWVACQDEGAVHVLSGRNGRRLSVIRLPFGSRPYGIAFSPDFGSAFITLEATGRLVRLDPDSRSITGSLDLGPTPRGLAITHDGRRILVTRHISPMTRPGAADHGVVWEVDGGTLLLTRTFRLEADTARDGATNGRGVPTGLSSITISPDGRYALVPATKANTQKGLALDGTLPDFQTTVRAMVARLDLVANREDMAERRDVDNRSIPSSATFDAQGRFVFLTTQGTHKTPILLAHSLGDYSAVVPPDNTPEDLAQGRARELGPVGSVLAAGDSLLLVHYLLSREVGVYAVSRLGRDPIRTVALVRTADGEPLSPQVLFGKRLFHNAADTRMSKDGYLSCGVCHIDGGGDGRVWDFTHRGEGLRRTTDLRGRAAHGPLHWSANFDEMQDFEHDIRGPFGGEGFLDPARWGTGTLGRPLGERKAGHSPELDALAAYVASLATVPPSPFRTSEGRLTEAGKRGRALFEKEEVGCARCHAAPHFTDSRLPVPGSAPVPGPVAVFPGATSRRTAEGFLLHDVGTRGPRSGFRMGDTLPGLDTPTLKGIWIGGPYLHDGSAETLLDVLETANHGDKHGKTSHLSLAEKEDLVAYLLQIDDLDDEGAAGLREPGKPRTGTGPVLSASLVGGQVRIRYRFPAAGPGAEARLYDLEGRIVSVFRAPPGSREGSWIWDGRIHGGRPAGAGLYVLKAGIPGHSGPGVPILAPGASGR